MPIEPDTERLFWSDPYLRTFQARVVARREHGGRHQVALDRTAFYPEGGGQPADRGRLGALRVEDVQAEDGRIWHALASPLSADEVEGEIDWDRRFDHMQQHHGQHLLSAAFEEGFALPTLAFHLGADAATIDLPGKVSEDTVRAAEDRTNQIIWEDRPVEIRIVPPGELAALPLRKPPAVAGPVRVVSVPGFDHTACGGTHPNRTGAVGLLHVRRRERRGAETRVEFVCGGRALRDLRARNGILSRLTAGLSVGLDELEAAVERLRGQSAAQRKQLDDAVERLMAFEAKDLVARVRTESGRPIVALTRDDLSPAAARALVNALVREGASAVLGVQGEKAQLIVARPAEGTEDCGAVLRAVLQELGGRGGGQPAMAQGGVPDPARLADAVARATALLGGD